jgi:hypothetical protein
VAYEETTTIQVCRLIAMDLQGVSETSSLLHTTVCEQWARGIHDVKDGQSAVHAGRELGQKSWTKAVDKVLEMHTYPWTGHVLLTMG